MLLHKASTQSSYSVEVFVFDWSKCFKAVYYTPPASVTELYELKNELYMANKLAK